MSFKDAYLSAMRRLPEGVRWAEANIKKTESTIVTAKDGAFDSAAVENADASYVRAAITGAGMAYTQDLSADPTALILQAAQNGMLSGEVASGDALAADILRVMPMLPPGEEAARLSEKACCVTHLAQQADVRVVSAICAIREDTHTAFVLNSRGTQTENAFRVYTCELDIAASENGQTVNTSALVTAPSLDALDITACVREALSKAEEQFLPVVSVPAGSYPAVLDHSVMCNIFITAWQLFSAAKYEGGASALCGLLGKEAASEAVTVIDRPIHPACGYRYDCDDEATGEGDHTLIDRGVLTGLLHTRATALRAGAQPTGNAGRVALLTGSIPTALIPLPRVLTVEPGSRSRGELLAAMGDGLLIPFSFDIFHSINITSGDFSIPCRAIVVKDGRMIGQCRDLTMSGCLRDLLSSIEELGSDLCIQPFLLRSYCYGAPSARISALRIG